MSALHAAPLGVARADLEQRLGVAGGRRLRAAAAGRPRRERRCAGAGAAAAPRQRWRFDGVGHRAGLRRLAALALRCDGVGFRLRRSSAAVAGVGDVAGHVRRRLSARQRVGTLPAVSVDDASASATPAACLLRHRRARQRRPCSTRFACGRRPAGDGRRGRRSRAASSRKALPSCRPASATMIAVAGHQDRLAARLRAGRRPAAPSPARRSSDLRLITSASAAAACAARRAAAMKSDLRSVGLARA